MRTKLLLIPLLAALGTNVSCVQTECGDGTIEQDGVCVASGLNKDKPICGPFTELHGDRCEPIYAPTQCDPMTSEPNVDPITGITTCKGTGGGGCGSPLSCPAPGGTKMTICGQLYDIETRDLPFSTGPTATGLRCDNMAPASSGPCALTLLAFDALKYGNNQADPAANVTPSSDNIYIDDCGRFKVSNIETNGTGPFIGIGVTEAGKLPQRPLDQLTVTATTGFAVGKKVGGAVERQEGFIAKPSTITSWQNSGGPPLSGGIYVGLFRKTKTGTEPQPGVKFTKSPVGAIPSQDYYFKDASSSTSTMIDINQMVTGMNGNGLLTGTSVNDATAYSGTGGIVSTHCTWENHAAANLANIVIFQIYRKADVPLDNTPCDE
jgi:hypothetical protein